MNRDAVRDGVELETEIANAGLQMKAVALEAGLDPAQLSRIVNGRQVAKCRQFVRLGRAIERLENRFSKSA